MQPGKTFADEIEGRLKVIACLERPNMVHSEDMNPVFNENMLKKRSTLLQSGDNDAQIVFWAPEEDMKTAMETIEERCMMAFEGVPNETRKALDDGTTIFERVLPGADRMYPDTDSAPIPIKDENIENIRKALPIGLNKRMEQLKKWKIPEDCYYYILRNNLMPLLEKMINELKVSPKWAGTLLGHKLKHIEGQNSSSVLFEYELVYQLIEFLQKEKIDLDILCSMLEILYMNPRMEFESILNLVKFERHQKDEILKNIPSLRTMFKEIGITLNSIAEKKWIMGRLRPLALGNIQLKELHQTVQQYPQGDEL